MKPDKVRPTEKGDAEVCRPKKVGEVLISACKHVF